ncbi:MAG: twin-arginine translocation signal domain-containing protein [Desulfatitalea sp.]|nr:twin-arginine translocation signal domain-containing protein [Desulfatitalea sp.]
MQQAAPTRRGFVGFVGLGGCSVAGESPGQWHIYFDNKVSILL